MTLNLHHGSFTMSQRASVLAAVALLATGVASTAIASPTGTPEATPADYCARDLGQWFYCERPVEEQAAPDNPEIPSVTPMRAPELIELEQYQKELEEARNIASWRPSPENVERYYRLQQVALDKGGLFADYYRRLVWTNPELDYTVKRPVVEVAKHGWTDDRLADRDRFLQGISDKVGLFYVYRGNCGPCSIASPIVKGFANRYGVNVQAISSDGAPNEHFPNARRDQGQLQQWGVRQMTPALLFFQASDVDPRTGQVNTRRIRGANGEMMELLPCRRREGCLTYAGAGVMSQEDIAERLFVLLSKEPGTDF